MAYTKVQWRNNQSPPINADNLNHIEQGIYEAHQTIAENTQSIESLTTQAGANTSAIALEKIQRQQADSAETLAREQADNVLSARMDTFTQLPSGSTSGDAELIDIRVGADGITYPTAGDAVRGQYSELKSAFDNRISWTIHDIFTLQGAVEGEYVNNDGSIGQNQYVGHTDYIDVSSYTSLTLALLADTGNHVSTYQGAFYDSGKNYISGYRVGSVTTDREYTINVPNNVQYLIFDYVLIRENEYYIKALTKDSCRTPIAQHFYFTGEEPALDTQNKTITFYRSCPFVVAGKAYGCYNVAGDWVVNLPENIPGVREYYGLFLDLINSTRSNLEFIWVGLNGDIQSLSNLAYIGQYNSSIGIFSFPFNVRVDGTLYYALGSDVYPRLDFLDNKFIVECDYQTYSGGYVKASDGTVASNNQTGYTSYIDVSAFSTIRCPIDHTSTYQMAFYDVDKVFVSGAQKQATAPYVWDILVPTNAKYARLSFYLDVENIFYAKGFIDDLQAFVKLFNSDNNKFSQMKMNCLGDSITYGYIPDSGAQMANPYPSELKNILGLAECRNYGISGSTLAVNSGNYQPMCLRYTDMSDDADIVLVFGGTNDYGRAVYTPTLGTISDNVNTTVYGALNILCEGLITKYPKAFIFLCTPLKRADKTAANGGGYTLEDVAEAIRAVGLKFGMPVLDLDAKGGFYISNATFRAQYGGNDKLHPNQAFDNAHLAPMIASFIKSNM